MIHASQKYNDMTPEELYEHIPEDEPVFLLRAQDVYSVGRVRKWVQLLKKDRPDSPTVHEVEVHIQRMIEWQTDQGCHIPD